MIKLENTEVIGWEAAIRGRRAIVVHHVHRARFLTKYDEEWREQED